MIFRTAADDYLLTSAEPNLAWFAGLVGRQRVTIEDATAADRMFTDLMGDKVEPRKHFIEKHAKEVRFLDV